MKTKLKVWGSGAIVALLLSFGVYQGCKSPTITTTQPLANTTVSVVAKPTLDIKTVDKIIVDPTQQALINQLLIENKKLKLEVTSLTSTVAKLETKGGVGIDRGTITEVIPSVTNGPENPPLDKGPGEGKIYSFKDYQLEASYDSLGTKFTYDLTQTFNIVTTTGYGKDNSKLSIVKLYRTGPTGTPVEVPSVTKEVFADERTPRWFLQAHIQGGIAFPKAGLVGLQWLKHGKSSAAEDTRYSILTPAIAISSGKLGLTLLPVSVNLGGLKHSPFTNLWVSPTVDLTKRVGVAITATF